MSSSRLSIALIAGLVSTLSGCLSFPGGGLSPSSRGAASLNGGIIGKSSFSQQLSNSARARAVEAEYQALQFGSAGEPTTWSAGGASGRVVPTQVYRVGSQDCRGYTQYVDGAQASGMTGTACRAGDGVWVLV